MSSTLFIALPLLFGFATPLLSRLGKNALAYTSVLMQLSLLGLALSLLLAHSSTTVELISIAAPLGISFVLSTASLLMVLLFTLLMTLFSLYYLFQRRANAYANESKFFTLLNMLLAASIGLVLSSDIFNIYVFFEIAGISAYILSAYSKTALALESGLKYLLTGAVASIFLLFAIVLIYLHVGSLNLAVIAEQFQLLPYNVKLLISLLLLIGFGFKVEVFPLNFWVTDVYQGSTSLVNALFSGIVVKAYLFVFFHILYLFLPQGEFTLFLLYLGGVSMLVAEVAGLRQTNLKRLFAYSSLGQVALIFVAFAMQNIQAVQAAFFIVIAHSLAKFMLFLALASLEKTEQNMHIDRLKQIDSPFLMVMMFLAMLSLLGIPLFVGFVGKFLLLKSLAVEGMLTLLVMVVVASFIEAIYYFKLMGYMLHKGTRSEKVEVSLGEKMIFVSLGLSLLLLGVFPMSIAGFLQNAAEVLLDQTAYITLLVGG